MVLWDSLRTPRETVEMATRLRKKPEHFLVIIFLWSCFGNLPGELLSSGCGNLDPSWSPVNLNNLAVHLRHQPVLFIFFTIASPLCSLDVTPILSRSSWMMDVKPPTREGSPSSSSLSYSRYSAQDLTD